MQDRNETQPDSRKHSERKQDVNQVDCGPKWNDREFKPGKQVERYAK